VKYGHDDEGKRCINTSKALNFKSMSTAEIARSKEHCLKSRSEALQQRSISVVCSQSRSMAISAIRSVGTYSEHFIAGRFQVSIERAASVLDSIAPLTYDQQEDSQNGEEFSCLTP
jgi:uncharacterized protein YbcI